MNRKRMLASTVLTLALLPAAWTALAAQGAPKAAAAPAKIAAAAKIPPGYRGEVQRELDQAEKYLVSLASAMPADKFSWRPAPGVRSFGEVLLHVAGGNYEIGAIWGMKTPAAVNLATIEKQGADKGNAVAALRVSFEQLRQSIAAMPDSMLEKSVDAFGDPTTVRGALLGAVSHSHEHLGQAIAYARMNGVVPPWTAAQQKAAAKPKS